MTKLIGSCMLSLGLAAWLAPTAAAQLQKASEPARDVRQTTQARALLAQETALAEFNIGVMVKDRVATLWGPVPSAEVAFRAELCLRTMLGLAEVRNELVVFEPVEVMQRPIKREPPRESLPELLLPELLPPELPKDTRLPSLAPGMLTGKSAASPGHENASSAKSGNSPPMVTAKSVSPMSEVAEPTLTSAIRQILQSNDRYRAVQFSVRGKRVFLRTTDAFQSDALQDAARQIARLPQVEGVVVLNRADQEAPD